MDNTQIQLAGIWVALMLTYLLGDVMRIFSGDFERQKKNGEMKFFEKHGQKLWLGMTMVMTIPIIMIVLTLLLDYEVNRWINIVLAAFFFMFNIIGLPTYPGWYDRFLIVVGLGFNVLTVVMAWRW